MKNILLTLILLFGVESSNLLLATEKVEVCIQYLEEYGWSKRYAVEGSIISGSALNSAVDSFTRFNVLSTYLVVFWNKDEASIFELPSSTFGYVPLFETEVEDQYGRIWKIRKGHLLCI